MTVLDTHALIWLVAGSDRLGGRARRLIDAALADESLAVSAISFWEIAMLERKGRIVLHQPAAAWRTSVIDLGVTELPLDGGTAILAATLRDLHDDPADRFIVAAASLCGAMLVTADDRILGWPGSVKRHDARV